MKKLLSIAVALLFSTFLHAQDVTQFLGIPVDGTKEEMINKLKQKGYRSSSVDKDVLEGEFNGKDVRVYIATNNNRVWRIMVCDANYVDEAQIKIRFNNLCKQFENNPKYTSLTDDQTIPEKEDISYQMLIKNKQYQASYYQSVTDTVAFQEYAKSLLLPKYTKEQLADPSEEILLEITKYIMEYCLKKNVWFTISSLHGKYYISMFYDNGYNEANGEDL